MEPSEPHTSEAPATTAAQADARDAGPGPSRGCLTRHLREAIRLNRERLPRYARLTDDASVPISRRLIRMERLALPGAWLIDRWARRWQRRGVPVVCADFVPMDAVPPFRARMTTRPPPASGFEPPDPRALRRGAVAAYRAEGFPAVDRVLTAALEAARAYPGYGCMLRHLLESMLRITRLAPEHARRARTARLAPPTRLSWLLVRTHLLLLGRALALDRLAAPLQARGIPILRRDVPPIPLPPALTGGPAVRAAPDPAAAASGGGSPARKSQARDPDRDGSTRRGTPARGTTARRGGEPAARSRAADGNPNIAARLAEHAARHPTRPAIVEPAGRRSRRISFGELADDVAALAAGLRADGVRPGDRILLLVPMSIDLYSTILACLHAGATVVFADAWAGRERVERAVEVARPRAFIGSPRAHLLRLVSRGVRRIPIHWTAGGRLLRIDRYARPTDADAPEPVAAQAPALITFTTGSTGRPKAAARSHAFLWAQHRALAGHLRLTERDIDLPTLPIFVLNNLASGTTTVLPDFDPRRPADIDPARIYDQIAREGVTTASGSPAFYERLATWCRGTGRRLPLRALFTGGASVHAPLARLLAATVDGATHVVYGSTEAEPIAGIDAGSLLAAAAEDREAGGPGGLCVGRPVDPVDVRIIRPHEGPVVLDDGGWAAREAHPGDTGEIVVAGAHVLSGYYGQPAEDARRKIRDGSRTWHRTGDAGRFDARGRLWLMGRISRRVERDGTGWWPLPAEARALEQADVQHAAYLGVPDARLGERAVLCVETPTGRLAPEREERLRRALEPIPVDDIRAFDRIPRDARHASRTDAAALRRRLDRAR